LRPKAKFLNTDTGVEQNEDPRLDDDDDLGEWKRVDNHELEADNPMVYDCFKNMRTGEVMNSDPRMLPDALRARGVKLTEFTLV